MKLLTRQELQNQINSQHQDLANKLITLDGQIKLKLDEYNLLESKFEERKNEIENEYSIIISDLETKKSIILNIIKQLEKNKEQLASSIEEFNMKAREQAVASRELDLDGKESDYSRRENLLDANNKEHSLKMATLLQALTEVEGRKLELGNWESDLNKRFTQLKDSQYFFEKEKQEHIALLEQKENTLKDRTEYLNVIEDSHKKITQSLEEGKEKLRNDIIHFESQQNTLESVYIDLKKKGLI